MRIRTVALFVIIASVLSVAAFVITFSFLYGRSNHAEETKWAVLVAGSKGYYNYRHQADVCHAYQLLKRGGLKDENIIVFMYDDIAESYFNPSRGVIINSPHGEDVYKGVPKDYTGVNVTASNVFAVLLGDKAAVKGGSGKVVDSGPNDRIFIYMASHGYAGAIGMPSKPDKICAENLYEVLEKMHASKKYKSLVFYLESCMSGSMFYEYPLQDLNIYATTSASENETSKAAYCPSNFPVDGPNAPSEYKTCLGDKYSIVWMEDSHSHRLNTTLRQQYHQVKNKTTASHVMEYGDLKISLHPISLYMGGANATNNFR